MPVYPKRIYIAKVLQLFLESMQYHLESSDLKIKQTSIKSSSLRTEIAA